MGEATVLKRIKNLINTRRQAKQQKRDKLAAEAITILHPADLNLRPVKSEYVIQYRIRRGHWEPVPANTTSLPKKKKLRMWRKDTYRVPEGFRSSKGQVVLNGSYISFEYLGVVDASHFNLRNGKFTPEGMDTTPHEKTPQKQYRKNAAEATA